MHIVVEGPDNAGKSTLISLINERLPTPRTVIPSEGREKYEGELNERAARYLSFTGDLIFDRHPCISQPIYNTVYPNDGCDQDLINQLYAQRPLLIYCRADVSRGMAGHVDKQHDQAEYLELISKKYAHLCHFYDQWALDHAHIFYRIGDDMEKVCRMVQGALRNGLL